MRKNKVVKTKVIDPAKLSKKEQKKLNAAKRCGWGEINPVTRSVPSGKTYNRKKVKDWDRKVRVEESF